MLMMSIVFGDKVNKRNPNGYVRSVLIVRYPHRIRFGKWHIIILNWTLSVNSLNLCLIKIRRHFYPCGALHQRNYSQFVRQGQIKCQGTTHVIGLFSRVFFLRVSFVCSSYPFYYNIVQFTRTFYSHPYVLSLFSVTFYHFPFTPTFPRILSQHALTRMICTKNCACL